MFHPDYAVRQALLVDAKAEKEREKARIQTSQTSLRIMRRTKEGAVVDEHGTLPSIVVMDGQAHVTTTIFVKFSYNDPEEHRSLKMIRLACLPNGMLQARYNPNPDDTIWSAGPHSPLRGERFRVRLSFPLLKQKEAWRVQDIPLEPPELFVWEP